MGATSKHSPQRIAQAVKRYANGEPVRALAKEYKISVPGMYLWIAKARNAASGAPSVASAANDPKVPPALRIKALEAENERLRRRILDLMLKYGEL